MLMLSFFLIVSLLASLHQSFSRSFDSVITDSKTSTYKISKILQGVYYEDSIHSQHVDLLNECGKANSIEGRIIGGSVVVPNSYPWMVALFFPDYFCGGSLISEEWVLTAAHCVIGRNRVDVVLGGHDVTKPEPPQARVKGIELIAHEKFLPYTYDNDVGLVRLGQKVTFNQYIRPICLPSANSERLPPGTIVTLTGWGASVVGNPASSPILLHVDVPIMSEKDCRDVYGNVVTNSKICTVSEGGKGICWGDSGGPMNYQIDDVTYVWGISSFIPLAGCASGLPHGFTRVASHTSWIYEKTGLPLI